MTKLLRSSAALDAVREGLLACLGMLTGDVACCVPVVLPVVRLLLFMCACFGPVVSPVVCPLLGLLCTRYLLL